MVDFGPMNEAVLDTFRETVTIGAVDADAIFDSRHYLFDAGEAGGSALVTSIAVKAAIAATITVDSTIITARGVDYVAREKRPDGEGWVVVDLERAP